MENATTEARLSMASKITPSSGRPPLIALGDFPALVFRLRHQDVTDVLAHFLDRRVPLPLAKGPQEAV